MRNENATRSVGDVMREDSLNNTLDRAINRLENELQRLDSIANALDGQSPPTPTKAEVKQNTPGHTLWKAMHIEDLIGQVADLNQRIYANISG